MPILLMGKIKKHYGQNSVVLPEGLAQELLQIVEIPKRSHLIDCTMVSPIPKCKVDASKKQMHLNTSPTWFVETRGRQTGFMVQNLG